LKVPIIFIIEDMQGETSFLHYLSLLQFQLLDCLCPKCNVRGDESGNPLVQCKKINTMVRMKQMVKDNEGYFWTIPINTRCIVMGDFMSVTVVADLVYSVPCILLSRCTHLKMESFLIVSPSCSRTKCIALKQLDKIVRHLMWLPLQGFASSGTEPCMPCLLWKDCVMSLTDPFACALC
jgi:hypothetical protein